MSKVKTIAFYLPQFHPVPENDQWWGSGFTEWTNVVQAKALYPGHDQPRRPADLGFYDLRVPEVREAQAKLALDHGIDGFCYYYYWFGAGKKLLERPIQEVLTSGQPDFPFCFCWANESWSRRWDGREHDTLIDQDTSAETCISLIKSMAPYFADKRYIRVGDKPLLLIYRANVFKNIEHTIQTIRQEARQSQGLELYLVLCEAYGSGKKEIEAGFDAIYEFPSAYSHTQEIRPTKPVKKFHSQFSGMIRDYKRLAEFYKSRPEPDYRRFPGVTLAWDNTARKKDAAVILENFSIESYESWLKSCVSRAQNIAIEDEQFIFINAWNEWAEGTYLEPDAKYGMEYLLATKSVLAGSKQQPKLDESFTPTPPLHNALANKDSIVSNPTSLMRYTPYIWRMDELEDKVLSAGYFDRPRKELFKGIGNPGKAMLDVGCGSGATSAALKLQYPESKFFGVELNSNMAKHASKKLDKVISCNFEELDLGKHAIKENMFDTILFADVLEHMYNPWQALEFSKKLLSKNGKIVASIPNIFNLQVVDNLAAGRWNYHKYGILDITHIRFFTLETIAQMFKETGFVVRELYTLPVPDNSLPAFNLSEDRTLETDSFVLKNVSDLQMKKLMALQFVVIAGF
jgi:ubiquinone/menaquinone biosynthesis C-methylase UbiE